MDPRQSYREAAVRGASPVRLVILLYEQAVEDLRRALSAHGRGDIEQRTREIDHAILVLGHLQATLDKNQGGRVAEDLGRFYDQVRAGLVEAQFKQSAAALELQISHLMLVRDAWCEVERATAPPTAGTGSAPQPAESARHSSAEWNA
jgi:flagellar protein FliS